MKTLVVCYSRTGNTRLIAEAVAAELNADIEELRDPMDYKGVMGFMRGGRDALRGRTAPIQPLQKDLSGYELIVIGQPVWAARPVPAVRGFLATARPLTARIALFVTYDGGGAEGCLDKTAELAPPGKVVAKASFLKVAAHRVDRVRAAREWAASLRSTAGA